ncbi:unnamed protein product [Prorocentrum cordatum]|uniref:Uncharacterized protein n=1 Tax=Prorocentrum cordatum TaxID=2364126 RepID=A0ABN9PEV6_9DINO|nr:unnamed protein product [Polarella glacialis]
MRDEQQGNKKEQHTRWLNCAQGSAFSAPGAWRRYPAGTLGVEVRTRKRTPPSSALLTKTTTRGEARRTEAPLCEKEHLGQRLGAARGGRGRKAQVWNTSATPHVLARSGGEESGRARPPTAETGRQMSTCQTIFKHSQKSTTDRHRTMLASFLYHPPVRGVSACP